MKDNIEADILEIESILVDLGGDKYSQTASEIGTLIAKYVPQDKRNDFIRDFKELLTQ